MMMMTMMLMMLTMICSIIRTQPTVISRQTWS